MATAKRRNSRPPDTAPPRSTLQSYDWGCDQSYDLTIGVRLVVWSHVKV